MASVWSKTWKIGLVVWVIGAVGILTSYRVFSSPSGSMIPTIRVGDTFIVSMASYGLSTYVLPSHPKLFSGRLFASRPAQGDVVIFKLPRDNSTDYIKRIIGLPGDKVQMREGRLYLNGGLVPREPIAKLRAEDYYGHVVEVPTYKETLPNGVSYAIIEIQGDTGFNDNTGVFEVPADNYFVLGDNRDNSTDSRIAPEQGGVGFVPFDNIEGRAELVFLSQTGENPTLSLRPIH